jgi:hypothetical protein
MGGPSPADWVNDMLASESKVLHYKEGLLISTISN